MQVNLIRSSDNLIGPTFAPQPHLPRLEGWGVVLGRQCWKEMAQKCWIFLPFPNAEMSSSWGSYSRSWVVCKTEAARRNASLPWQERLGSNVVALKKHVDDLNCSEIPERIRTRKSTSTMSRLHHISWHHKASQQVVNNILPLPPRPWTPRSPTPAPQPN